MKNIQIERIIKCILKAALLRLKDPRVIGSNEGGGHTIHDDENFFAIRSAVREIPAIKVYKIRRVRRDNGQCLIPSDSSLIHNTMHAK